MHNSTKKKDGMKASVILYEAISVWMRKSNNKSLLLVSNTHFPYQCNVVEVSNAILCLALESGRTVV